MQFSKQILDTVKILYPNHSDDFVCRQIHMHKNRLYNILQILNIQPHNKQENRHNSRAGYTRPNNASGSSDSDACCNACSTLICADCCCECMGGDLIPCC